MIEYTSQGAIDYGPSIPKGRAGGTHLERFRKQGEMKKLIEWQEGADQRRINWLKGHKRQSAIDL